MAFSRVDERPYRLKPNTPGAVRTSRLVRIESNLGPGPARYERTQGEEGRVVHLGVGSTPRVARESANRQQRPVAPLPVADSKAASGG